MRKETTTKTKATKKAIKKTTKRTAKTNKVSSKKKVVQKKKPIIVEVYSIGFGWGSQQPRTHKAKIAEAVLPELKKLRNNCFYYPKNMDYTTWIKILDEMIFGFEYILKAEKNQELSKNEELKVRAIKGQVLFGKYLSLLI